MLHLMFIRGMSGILLAYLVQCHVKVAHILPEYSACLNFYKEMITRAQSLTQG